MNALNALNELLDDEVAPVEVPLVAEGAKMIRTLRKTFKVKKPEVITPLAIVPVVAPVVEEPVVEEDNDSVTDSNTNTEASNTDSFEACEAYIASRGGITHFVAEFKALLAFKEGNKVNKTALPKDIHLRLVNGKEQKCKYLRDGGVNLYKTMTEGQLLVGVSCVQKGVSKSVKKADYNLEWINSKVVKDVNTGIKYPHSNGKMTVVKGDNVSYARLMLVTDALLI